LCGSRRIFNRGSPRLRASPCNQCDACLGIDCGECSACVDKPKFGGPNKSRKRCVNRACASKVTYERPSVETHSTRSSKRPRTQVVLPDFAYDEDIAAPAKKKSHSKGSHTHGTRGGGGGPGNAGGTRIVSCGECPACNRTDCGRCNSCLDKPKFGGPGTKKQRCLHRLCEMKVASKNGQKNGGAHVGQSSARRAPGEKKEDAESKSFRSSDGSVVSAKSQPQPAPGFPPGWFYSVSIRVDGPGSFRTDKYFSDGLGHRYRSFKEIEDNNPGLVYDREDFLKGMSVEVSGPREEESRASGKNAQPLRSA